MKNIVTGASGFLGSHLVKRLEGETLIIPHEKIQSIKLPPFEKGFFLSSYGNMAFHDDDAKIYKANIADLITILTQKATYKGFKSFVFISTSSVRLPVQTMYSRSKKAAEEILLAFMEKHKLPICIIRPFTIYGCGDAPTHLIPTILRSCFKGELMNFVSEPIHDYIFVEDVVDGIINLSEHSARGIYELGTGVQTSNQEVLDLIEEITGKKAKINKVVGLREYDTTNWVSTNYKSRSWGWLPKVALKEGLKKVVEDYISNPKKYDK